MKKITTWLLLVCLILSAVGSFAVAEEKPVIVIARSTNALIEDMNTNDTTLMLEEKFNVDLQFMEFPSEDALQKLSVIINTGSDLPDVININLDDATITSYASKGVLLPLDEYLDNPEMMTHFYEDWYEITDDYAKTVMNNITMADGHRYSLPSTKGGPWNLAPLKMFINYAWLEKLDLEMPTTTDELYDVLTAFVTQDPNGNGKADEIGILGGNGWPFCNFTGFLLGSFIPNTFKDGYYYVEDGKVKAAFAEDAFRDGLEYVFKLVDEGLIYPASFTQDATQGKAIVTNTTEGYTVGLISTASDSGMASVEFFENYKMMGPVEGPDGVCYSAYNNPGCSQNWFVTTSCENPELAFAIGEYGYSFDVTMTERYGTKDVNWTADPEIAKNYTPKIPGAGYETMVAVLDDTPWTTISNTSWKQSLPYTQTDAYIAKASFTQMKDDSERNAKEMFDTYYMTITKELYGTHGYPNLIGKLPYTEEETMAIADITTAINTYRDENITRFVTGSRDLAEWDDFVEELYAMGLETQLEYMQTAYDRAHN